MKMLRRLLYILPVIGIMIASCVDIESKDFEHIMPIFVHGRQPVRVTDVLFSSDGSATGLPRDLFVKDIWLLCRTASTWYRCGVVHSA